MRKGIEGNNKVWQVIHTDENENTINAKSFDTFDKPKIQAYINHYAKSAKSGDLITYGTSCDEYAFYTLFEVENFNGVLKRLLINSTANLGKPVYKPFTRFCTT